MRVILAIVLAVLTVPAAAGNPPEQAIIVCDDRLCYDPPVIEKAATPERVQRRAKPVPTFSKAKRHKHEGVPLPLPRPVAGVAAGETTAPAPVASAPDTSRAPPLRRMRAVVTHDPATVETRAGHYAGFLYASRACGTLGYRFPTVKFVAIRFGVTAMRRSQPDAWATGLAAGHTFAAGWHKTLGDRLFCWRADQLIRNALKR